VSFLTGLFVVILAGMGISALTEVIKAFARRGRSAPGLAELKAQLEQHATALEEAQTALADQDAQLTELQERLDFAERLLTQARERGALEPGTPRQQRGAQ
jgi:chromosome segregation ATPase